MGLSRDRNMASEDPDHLLIGICRSLGWHTKHKLDLWQV